MTTLAFQNLLYICEELFLKINFHLKSYAVEFSFYIINNKITSINLQFVPILYFDQAETNTSVFCNKHAIKSQLLLHTDFTTAKFTIQFYRSFDHFYKAIWF